MQNPSISISYALKWQVKNNTHIKISAKGLVFNTRTGRQLKRCYNNRSVGYWIGRDFYPLQALKKQLEKIPTKQFIPF